jgi:hypothetical protein
MMFYSKGDIYQKAVKAIAHIGRRSGKVRRTILAVLRFDDKTKEIYAESDCVGKTKMHPSAGD